MESNWLSAMVAGVTAAVFWTSFSLWFGGEEADLKLVGMWAVIFHVIGVAGTFVIAQVISARKRAVGQA
jgi:hypothetical protein